MDDDTRKRLKIAVAELRQLTPLEMSPEVIEFLAGNIEIFLNGRAKTLDEAFASKGKRKPAAASHERIAREMDRMRDEGKSWADIDHDVDGKSDWPKSDRQRRDIYKKFEEENPERLEADRLIRELNKK